MSLKGILFDFNGTLVFDSDMHIEALRRVVPEYGVRPPTKAEMSEKIFGITNKKFVSEWIDPNCTEELVQDFVKRKENEYINVCLECGSGYRLVDGATEFLDALKENNIPRCIATSSERINVDFYIKQLHLEKWFTMDNIVYENGSFRGKPEPDIYELAAKRIGLSPSECLVFEDGNVGIRAANAAGAGAVIAVYEEGLPSPITPDVKIDEIHHNYLEWKNILTKYGFMR